MLDGDLPKAPTAPASTELQFHLCKNFQPAFSWGDGASQRAAKWDGIVPWVQDTLGLWRSRFSSPSYHKFAQLQTLSGYICTASGNLARALIIQPTCPWNHWWLLPWQYPELGMSLSLSRSPAVLGLREEGWNPLFRNQGGVILPTTHALPLLLHAQYKDALSLKKNRKETLLEGIFSPLISSAFSFFFTLNTRFINFPLRFRSWIN